VVCYGLEFNLRSLSVVALSEAECETWYRGLKYLIQVGTDLLLTWCSPSTNVCTYRYLLQTRVSDTDPHEAALFLEAGSGSGLE
jgi:hypothetical protein